MALWVWGSGAVIYSGGWSGSDEATKWNPHLLGGWLSGGCQEVWRGHIWSSTTSSSDHPNTCDSMKREMSAFLPLDTSWCQFAILFIFSQYELVVLFKQSLNVDNLISVFKFYWIPERIPDFKVFCDISCSSIAANDYSLVKSSGFIRKWSVLCSVCSWWTFLSSMN